VDTAQVEVRTLLEERSESMRAKDIERLMALYSADIVYFDLVPPLRYVGAAALRERFVHWFEGWIAEIVLSMSELNILVNDDIAGAHMLLRASGTRMNGQEVGYWVRTSNFCRRIDGEWLITHEHVSLPVDFASGRAVMNLAP
jgi:ketosteroid isomerase-like protein